MGLTTQGGNNLSPQRVKEIKQIIFDRDGWRCVRCKWRPPPDEMELQIGVRHEKKGSRFLTLDHITPRAMGGSSREDNLQTMCNVCNEAKGDRLQAMQRFKGTCRRCGSTMTIKSRKVPVELDWYCC